MKCFTDEVVIVTGVGSYISRATTVTTFSDIRPEQAVAMATGNTAVVYELSRGIIAAGYEADLLLVDAPVAIHRHLSEK